jgi:hypothetical protein
VRPSASARYLTGLHLAIVGSGQLSTATVEARSRPAPPRRARERAGHYVSTPRAAHPVTAPHGAGHAEDAERQPDRRLDRIGQIRERLAAIDRRLSQLRQSLADKDREDEAGQLADATLRLRESRNAAAEAAASHERALYWATKAHERAADARDRAAAAGIRDVAEHQRQAALHRAAAAKLRAATPPATPRDGRHVSPDDTGSQN